MFKKILVCLDGSKLAEQVLPYAIEEARRFDAKLVLLRVVHPPLAISPGVPGVSGGPIETEAMLEASAKDELVADAYLANIVKELKKKQLVADYTVVVGSPGESIVDYATMNKIGLIVMASHGRSGLKRAVMGSVADHVLRESGLPVLTIRPNPSKV